MAYYALWLDHENANLFHFAPGVEDKIHLKNSHHQDHHTGHHDQEKLEQRKKFFHDVAQKLAGATHILLVGPGMAKTEFKHYLENHHMKKIAEAIVGIEPMDHLTDGQVRDMAKRYFSKYNLFNETV